MRSYFLIRFRDDFRSPGYVSCWEPSLDVTAPPPFADQLIDPWQDTPDPATFRYHTLTDYFYQQSRMNAANPVYLFGDVYPRAGGQPVVYETLYNEAHYRNAGGIPEVLTEVFSSLGDPSIDFSVYDKNEDGYFDQVIMLFRSMIGHGGGVLAANGQVGLAGTAMMRRAPSLPLPVITRDGISINWAMSGQVNAIMNSCFNPPPGNYTVRKARPIVQLVAHELVHQYMEIDGVSDSQLGHLNTFWDNAIPTNTFIPPGCCSSLTPCRDVYTFSIMGGVTNNYNGNSTLTMAGHERVMLGYSVPTVITHTTNSILARDLFTTGDIYRIHIGSITGGRTTINQHCQSSKH